MNKNINKIIIVQLDRESIKFFSLCSVDKKSLDDGEINGGTDSVCGDWDFLYWDWDVKSLGRDSLCWAKIESSGDKESLGGGSLCWI